MKTKKTFILSLFVASIAICLFFGLGAKPSVKAETTSTNKDTFASYFTAVGDNGLAEHVKSISYGEFTADNFSGGGIKVEVRNKAHEYVDVTENDNTTNPLLINLPNVKYSTGVKFNGTIDLSDNNEDSSMLMELAFVGDDSNWQASGFKVVIEDASNPDKYITLFILRAYDNTDATGGQLYACAVASWETTNPNSMYDAGFDTDDYKGSAKFVRVGDGTDDGSNGTDPKDGCFLNYDEYGHAQAGTSSNPVTLSKASAQSLKIQFNNETGVLSVSGVRIRKFSKFSALVPADNGGNTAKTYGSNVFDRFSQNKAKVSVGILRSVRKSTDEFTNFYIMNIDGNSLKADENDNISYNGLDFSEPSELSKDKMVASFKAVGDENLVSYVKSLSYGDFTADKFSGGGLMVEVRNKAQDLVDHTETDNSTNPMLIDFPNVKYSAGVKFNAPIDVSDNTLYDTLIEVAFPGTNDNFQVRGFKVVIEDATDPTKYISLYIWNAYANTDSLDSGKSSIIATASASWETTNANAISSTAFDTDDYDNNGTADDGCLVVIGNYNSAGDSTEGKEICWINAGGPHGHRVTSIKFSRKSDNSIKIQFDNATGTLLVNGVRVRKFGSYSMDNEHYFDGFTDDKVKVSVGVARSVRRSTDEFTRFCVMSIDGNSLKADENDNIHFFDTEFERRYTVTYKADETDLSKVNDVLEGTLFSALTAPEIPAKEGHTIKGWSVAGDTAIATNLTAEAVYEINKYTVTFKAGDTTLSTVENVEYGTLFSAVTAPEIPAKEGYTAKGWSVAADTAVTANTTAEAVYEVITYTITFDTDGGTTIAPKQFTALDTITAFAEVPEKEGFDFEAWYLGTEKFEFGSKLTSDITLTAKYTAKEIIVTVKSADFADATIVIAYNTSVTASQFDNKEGYEFKGLFTDQALTTAYNGEALTQDTTLYASYEEIQEPTTVVEDPTTTVEDPTTTQEEPTTTQEEPTTTAEEPTTTAEQPTTTEKQPTKESETTTSAKMGCKLSFAGSGLVLFLGFALSSVAFILRKKEQ